MSKSFIDKMLKEDKKAFKKELSKLISTLDKNNFREGFNSIVPQIQELGTTYSFAIYAEFYKDHVFIHYDKNFCMYNFNN